MKNLPFRASILALCLLVSCGKETADPFTTTFYTGSKSFHAADYNMWVILQAADGDLLHVERVALQPNAPEQAYSTKQVSSSETCDVTIAFLDVNSGHLSLVTYKNIPSGKKLLPDIFTTATDDRTVYAQIDISGMPEFDWFECTGTSPESVFFDSPAPDFKASVFQLKTGGTGTLVRWKAKSDPNFRAYWHPINATTPVEPVKITLPATDFSADIPKLSLQLPYAADWWTNVRGVINPVGTANYACLANRLYDDKAPKIEQIEFEKPDNVNCSSFWVFAMDQGPGEQTELERLFPIGAPLTLATTGFRLKQFSLNSNGNILLDSEGDFDVLHILVFGNAGKVSWQIEGDPDDLKICPVPHIPDSLKQQWPALTGFDTGQTRCGEYEGLSGFRQYLDANRSESLWRARLGFRGKWQQW